MGQAILYVVIALLLLGLNLGLIYLIKEQLEEVILDIYFFFKPEKGIPYFGRQREIDIENFENFLKRFDERKRDKS